MDNNTNQEKEIQKIYDSFGVDAPTRKFCKLIEQSISAVPEKERVQIDFLEAIKILQSFSKK